jgi:hypothetical protein
MKVMEHLKRRRSSLKRRILMSTNIVVKGQTDPPAILIVQLFPDGNINYSLFQSRLEI